MRILLDTNILIHRETKLVINNEIGTLFYWLDKLGYQKCIHPVSNQEIETHQNKQLVESLKIKLNSYHILKCTSQVHPYIDKIINESDKTSNDKNDSLLLNELVKGRVDFIITEDRGIHAKARSLSLEYLVYTISSFLEKVTYENPDLVNYNVLSVRKEYFGNIPLSDSFFDTFREDYKGFDKWFNKKSDDVSYIYKSDKKLIGFLYLKPEGVDENYLDIIPPFPRKKRLKVGTFKTGLNGFKLGERFLKILFDNALKLKVDEIYITVFQKRLEQKMLISFLEDWGFRYYGTKQSPSGKEFVYVRPFNRQVNFKQPKLTFPNISFNATIFINPIYPEYHTELFPDSILRTESPKDFIENQPHRNSISKVFISRSFESDLQPGDIIVFYRTGGFHKSCVTTIGVVEKVIHKISNAKHFIKLCRQRSVFSDKELTDHWDYKINNRPFIVEFLYVYSFKKRPNLRRLIELGVIKDIKSAPRGFTRISKDDFLKILRESLYEEGFIINQT